MADFFDIMQLGEGEQMLQDICATVEAGKKAGWNKDQLLFELSKNSWRVQYCRPSMM